MKIVEGLIPPGGFHFYEGDVKLQGTSGPDIIRIIKEYRAANRLPAGDAEFDYLSFVCGQYPQNCHLKTYVHDVSPHPAGRRDELMDDVRSWANSLLMSQVPITLVTDLIAEARAKICLACPKNVGWKTRTCAPCVQAVDNVCMSIRQVRDTYTTAKIGGCLSLRHDNRTAVFLDKAKLNSVDSLPAHCWAK